MSRVFAKPKYQGSSICKLLACCDDGSRMKSRIAICGAVGIPVEVISGIHRLTGDLDLARQIEQMHLIGERMGLDKLRAVRTTGMKVVLPVLESAKKIVFGFEAQVLILLKYLEGTIKVESHLHHIPSSMSAPAKEAAAVGLTGSLASPKATAKLLNQLPTYDHAMDLFPEAMSAMAASEPWRYGVSSAKASDAMREVFTQGFTTVENAFNVEGGTFAAAAIGAETIVFLDLSVTKFLNDDVVYVMDRDERGHLAEVLYSCGMFAMYGMNWRAASGGDDGKKFTEQALSYIRNSIRARVDNGSRLDTLAKQIKSSYAIAIAKYGGDEIDDQERELLKHQLPILKEEADKLCDGEEPWYKIIERWPQEAQIDMGTAWNFLPPPQIIPDLLSDTMKRKTNAPREGDREALGDFLTYSATVISAHILVHIKDAPVVWSKIPVVNGVQLDMEEEAWVKACRSGNLTYPNRMDGVRIDRLLPWRDHISNWHFTAKDVTHVMADATLYASRSDYEALDDTDRNELLYALKYGDKLSKVHPAARIRTQFLNGELPGDRLEDIAGKSENTKAAIPLEGKVDSGTRETASGDDIGREAFTEIDRNLGLMGRILHGISSRSGRAGLEKMVAGILKNVSKNGCIMSLDVIGWSPSMWRELEMLFVDLLISFYLVPDGLKVSTVLKDVRVIMSKSGFHEVWEMGEGSIQGFFPTGDTILHSLVAQWALRRAKDKGKVNKNSTMAKATLIDDIIMAISHIGGDPRSVLMSICDEYKSLLFDPDIVKTLMSKIKGHFLNRLYCKGFEVLTPSKIFAKCDRDHERKLSTIHDRVGAVFGSMWGAMDRGSDPIWAYYVAHWRSLCLLRQAGGKGWEPTTSYSTATCWLSPGLGGMGIPSFAHWASRDSSTSMSSGIGVISTLCRTLETSDTGLHKTLKNLLYSLANSAVESKSAVAYMDDPFSVKLAGVIDPSLPAMTVMKVAQEKAITDPSFLAMLERTNSAEYEKAIHAFLKSAGYPGPIVAELAASLPHATIRALTIKAERNESLLKLVPFRLRREAITNIKKLNRAFVRNMGDSIMNLNCPPDIVPDSAFVLTALDASLQAKMGTRLAMTVRPPVCDIMTRVTDIGDSMIQLHLPAATAKELFNGVKGASIQRSKKSKALILFKHSDDDAWDPLSRSYTRALNALCMLSLLRFSAEVASALFALLWVGLKRVPYPSMSDMAGSNPARICSRTARTTHTCAAFPNASSAVKVPMSDFIRRFEEVRLSVDPLAMVFVMRACALADMAVCRGNSGLSVRGYSLRTMRNVLYPELDTSVDDDCIALFEKVRPALEGDQARRMMELMVEVASEVSGQAADDSLGEMGIQPGVVTAVGALAVLQRIPTGEVLNLLRMSSMAGGAHTVTRGAPNADVTAGSSRDTATAKTLREVNSPAMAQSLIRIANALSDVSSDPRKRVKVMNSLISREGEYLKALNISRQAEFLRQEEIDEDKMWHYVAVMSSVVVGGGNSLSRNPAAFWEQYITKHRARVRDPNSSIFQMSRSAIMAGGISVWPEASAKKVSASLAWAATITAAVREANVQIKNWGHEVIPRTDLTTLQSRACEYVMKQDGGVGAICSIAMAPARSEGWYEHSIGKGVYAGLKELWTYFKSDVLIALSEAERAMQMGTGRNVDPGYGAIAFVDDLDDIQGTTDAKDTPFDAGAWAQFCDEKGYMDMEHGEDDDIDEEFDEWTSSSRRGQSDVV
jgi:hypothetical protein